jgi:hypothetical protein
LCYKIKSESYCNCTDNVLNLDYSSKLCIDDQELKCIMHIYYEIFTKDNYVEKNCIPHCPLECKSIQLSTSLSSSQYPIENYFELLKNDKILQETVFKSGNWSFIKNSILKININYESLSYIYIRESEVLLFIYFISYIGGQMGLFLGTSFLSFIEMFEVLIEAFFIILKKY